MWCFTWIPGVAFAVINAMGLESECDIDAHGLDPSCDSIRSRR